MSRSHRRFLFWIAGGVLAGFVLSLELIYGSWFKAPGLWNLGIIRNADWSIDVSAYYEHEGPIRYKRDYFGLRGSYGQPQDISLLAIGNSTTDQRQVSEYETWTARLDACLKSRGLPVNTANAGVTGQTLRGMANNFDFWFSHIPGLKPRWVVAYFGATEIDLEGREDSDDVRRYYETEKAPPKWKNFQNWLKMNSALNQLFSDIKTNLKAWRRPDSPNSRPPDERMGERADQAVNRSLEESQAAAIRLDSPEFLVMKRKSEADLQDSLRKFEDRLIRLEESTRAFGAEPIFVTQNSARYRVKDGLVWGDLDQFLRLQALAERTLQVCRSRNIQCLNLAGELSLEDGDAYDGAHITAKGSARLADYLCDRLRLN